MSDSPILQLSIFVYKFYINYQLLFVLTTLIPKSVDSLVKRKNLRHITFQSLLNEE